MGADPTRRWRRRHGRIIARRRPVRIAHDGPIALHGGGEFLPGDEPFLDALLAATATRPRPDRRIAGSSASSSSRPPPRAAARTSPASNGIEALRRRGPRRRVAPVSGGCRPRRRRRHRPTTPSLAELDRRGRPRLPAGRRPGPDPGAPARVGGGRGDARRATSAAPCLPARAPGRWASPTGRGRRAAASTGWASCRASRSSPTTTSRAACRGRQTSQHDRAGRPRLPRARRADRRDLGSQRRVAGRGRGAAHWFAPGLSRAGRRRRPASGCGSSRSPGGRRRSR